MSRSKVVLLVLAVGLLSLFNGESGGCAYAKPGPTVTVEDGAVPADYYKTLFHNVELLLNTDSHGAITVGDHNTVQESQSGGFLNMKSRIDYSDNLHDESGSDDTGPGAFTVATHNTFQSSNSNMTTNMGSWITYGKNMYNGQPSKL